MSTPDEAMLLSPTERCTRCGMESRPNGLAANLRNFRCPQCMEKCCDSCFRFDFGGDGKTFQCPNTNCKAILKFP